MQIRFSSGERPTRVSKSIRKRLADAGHDLPYSRVREGVASMYGYRSWNDLLGNVGKGPRTPDDVDLAPSEARERHDAFAVRLSAALGIPATVAEDVIAAVGPTSGRVRTTFDVVAAVERMSRHLTASAERIEPFRLGDLVGFVATEHPVAVGRARYAFEDGVRGFSILVSDDGKRVVYERLSGRHPVPTGRSRALQDDQFGRHLQSAGLLAANSDPGKGEPHPLVHDTLSRLAPRALRLLRSAPCFSPEAFGMAASLDDGAPFAKLVDDFPLLASEFENVAHSLHDGALTDDANREKRKAILTSGDPLGLYVERARSFADRAWPHLPFDGGGAKRAVTDTCKIEVLRDLGVQPWHIAFLSFAPREKLPTTAAQVAAMIDFVEDMTCLFKEGVRMEPRDFYGSFDGDWVAADAVRLGRGSFWSPSVVLGEAAVDLSGAVLESAGVAFEPDGLDGDLLVSCVHDRLVPACVTGRGLDLLDDLRAWSSASEWKGDVPPSRIDNAGALSTTGVLPPSLRGLKPEDVLRGLGIDAAAFVETFEDETEASLEEIEARVFVGPGRRRGRETTVSGREILRGSTRFHLVEIGGMVFEGILSADGPYISSGGDGVALGCATSVVFDPEDGIWKVAKYSDEYRIDLRGFEEADVRRLASEFGMAMGHRMGNRPNFSDTPAGRGLAAMAATSPRIVAGYARYDSYMPGWYGQLAADVPEPARPSM